MWRAIAEFTDSIDGGRRYMPGDDYPRSGYEPPKWRIEELSTAKNRRGAPMIEKKDKETGKPKKDAR